MSESNFRELEMYYTLLVELKKLEGKAFDKNLLRDNLKGYLEDHESIQIDYVPKQNKFAYKVYKFPIKRFAEMYNEGTINWKGEYPYGNSDKYYLCYDTVDQELRISWTTYVYTSKTVYFTSKEVAEKAIEVIGKDKLLKALKPEEV